MVLALSYCNDSRILYEQMGVTMEISMKKPLPIPPPSTIIEDLSLPSNWNNKRTDEKIDYLYMKVWDILNYLQEVHRYEK